MAEVRPLLTISNSPGFTITVIDSIEYFIWHLILI